MEKSEVQQNPVLRRMVQGLQEALGAGLQSVVLYGSAARGDYEKATSDLNLILVLRDLRPATLEALTPVLERWSRDRQPMPRLFSPELILESADVFPIEFLDLKSHRVVLFGEDPFESVVVHTGDLRLQCERELREKMMRLREGYVQAHRKPKELKRLLTGSYGPFVALFRGCLRLHGDEVPDHNDEVVAAFAARAELDRSPFDDVSRLKRGTDVPDPGALFSRYYDQLTAAVHRVNRFESS